MQSTTQGQRQRGISCWKRTWSISTKVSVAAGVCDSHKGVALWADSVGTTARVVKHDSARAVDEAPAVTPRFMDCVTALAAIFCSGGWNDLK
jgi:hypothetical protein